MSKLFIFSNSFNTKTFAFEIDYVLNLKIDRLILLKENHSIDELIACGKFKIDFYSTLDECLSECDTVLLIIDDNIPEISQNYLESMCAKLNKCCIKIINPWKDTEPTYKICENYDYEAKPVVLLLSSGIASQPYCAEIMLNRLFYDRTIPIRQIFTELTRSVLSQLQQNGSLTEQLEAQLMSNEQPYNIIVYSIYIDEKLQNLKNFLTEFRTLSPDFIIFQSDINYQEFEKIKNIIEYNFFKKLDFFIKSNYHDINNLCYLYCNNNIGPNNDVEYIESETLKEKLIERILAKISFPEGIVAL